MDSSALGKKIKEARLAKKMTQAEVVGDFITRNMLSQIESGTATPSVKTLEYLCRVLELPLTYLMPSSDSVSDDCASVLARAKQLYLSGNYKELLAFEDPTGILSDEFHALKAKANLNFAKKLSEHESVITLQEAIEHAKQAAELSQHGIYSNEAVKAEAMLVLSNLAQHLSDYYKSMIAE